MELAIDPGPEPGTFAVRVLRSLSGDQPSGTIELDVDALVASVPGLEASVLASSVSSRRVMTERESAVQAVGAGLFGALFSGPVESAYRASAAVAAERGRSLQLALRLNAPGLAAIPWETLFDPATGAYLSRKEPIVRWVPGPHDPEPTDLDPPLRILGMIAAPRGLPVLDVEAEQRRLEEALRPQIDAGRAQLTWLAEASWHGIQSELLAHPWHVLHFVGHGGYDVATDEGLLALVGGDGRADYVSASRLADLLDEAEPTPRLVVLNSCQSGAASYTDLLSGTAAALVHSGIHAVAAMQFAITDAAAVAFSRAFYASLASGRPVGEAVRSGRIGILGAGPDTLEWVTPVLYLRGDDTRLLDPARLAAAPPVPWWHRYRRVAAIGGAIAVATAAAVLLLPRGGPPPSTETTPPAAQTFQPVQLAVPADQAWTATGVSCAPGDVLSVTATGVVMHGTDPTATATPDGLEEPWFHQFNVPGLPDANTAGLIGSLDEEQDFFVVGSGVEYECPRAGELFLGINDIGLDGNSGSWTATIDRIDAE